VKANPMPRRRVLLQQIVQGAIEVKALLLVVIVVTAGLAPGSALAGPSAETAKLCVHYSYLLYPYKRPGAVRMSGDRQAYFRDCMAKDGNVPAPVPAKS
jgi:hypothetical protein